MILHTRRFGQGSRRLRGWIPGVAKEPVMGELRRLGMGRGSGDSIRHHAWKASLAAVLPSSGARNSTSPTARARSFGGLWLCLLWLLTCSSASALPETRSFWMGFTPFPHDTTAAALDYTRDRLRQDADLIAHHLDEGIPWLEALGAEPVSGELASEWNYRKALSADRTTLVSITPIDISRSRLAPYFSPEGVVPLPEPWSEYTFDHPDVKTAFLNYARNTIDFFDPDYLVIGIEVNGLLNNAAEKWSAYLRLHRYVYTVLKIEFPRLPIMVSMIGIDLLEGASDVDHQAQIQGLDAILPYSDFFALSLYPFMSSFVTDTIPDDLFTRLRALSDKPMAVAETGYPAQPFTITFPDGPLIFEGTPAKQDQYLRLLFDSAQSLAFRFVVNFVLRDYDAIWEQLGRDETLAIWRDTGIYDEAGVIRPAGQRWLDWLDLPSRVTAWPGLGSAINGSWFNPDRGGEGFVFDLFQRNGASTLGLVVYFYTYDPEGLPLYLVGSVEDLSPGSQTPIIVEVNRTRGGTFGPGFMAADVEVIPWGELSIEFFECDSGRVSWTASDPAYGEGSTDITRLVPLAPGMDCF